MLRLTVNGTRVESSTDILIPPSRWNAKRQEIIGRDAEASAFNDRLTVLKSRAVNAFWDLDRKDVRITPQLLKNAMTGEVKPVPSLLKLAQEFVEERSGERAKSTAIRYGTALRVLTDYLHKQRKPGLLCNEFTHEMGKQYMKWLRSSGSRGTAYCSKLVRFVSQVLAHGHRQDHLRNNVLEYFEYPKVERTGGRPLTPEQLATLEEWRDRLPTAGIRAAADVLLFGCYTGLAYVDMLAFRANDPTAPSHLAPGPDGTRWLKGKRIKTGRPFRLPLLPGASRVLERYEAGKLPVPPNTKLNLRLKMVADLVPGLPAKLTSHVGRHTFVYLIGQVGMSDKLQAHVTGDTETVIRKSYQATLDSELMLAFRPLF